MKAWQPVPVIAPVLAIAGCAITPGPEISKSNLCNIPSFNIAIESGDGQPLVGNSFSQELVSVYSSPRKQNLVGPPISDSMLFLSGGSQHGAFGAGALDNWAKERPGGLPRFQVVTGVSTGAIMATHAFLNRTDPILTSFRIKNENQVLHPYVKNAEKPGLSDGLAIARKGALGNLQPMKMSLGERISDQVILDVALESRKFSRRLFVGSVDVDSGKAVVFDLTKLAEEFERQVNRRPRLRDCYLDAIVASSSVPLAAPPTFIDNRMYIDGGARFGLLADEIATAAENIGSTHRAADNSGTGGYPYMYVMINGDLSLDHKCGKVDPDLCSGSSSIFDGAHESWKITTLAARSVDILIDQIYRFSNSRIRDRARLGGFTVRMLRIHPDVMNYKTDIEHPGSEGVVNKCSEWRELDKKFDRPIEFHPRYMHCLTKYGDHRMATEGWSKLE